MVERTLETVLRRDRILVGAALVALAALSWGYLLWLSDGMNMDGMTMTGFRMIPAGRGIMISASAPWSAIEFALVFAMWLVMMIGMMMPGTAPMILIYARVVRQASAEHAPLAAVGWFTAGYLLAWSGFSLAATIAQWGLERAALLNSAMASASRVLTVAVLLAAGVYQWTALKDICLAQCRTPLMFLMRHGGFRPSVLGGLLLGLRHGAYCIGCCWALMALLLVGGVMNVLWIALLASLVLLEKLSPFGRWIARASGFGFLAAGAWLLT